MRTTRLLVACTLVLAALVAIATPASAHSSLAAFTGTAATSGTWAPVSPACGAPCPAGNSWSFSSTTDVLSNGTTGSGRVSAAGGFLGWCGDGILTGNATVDIHSATVAGHMIGQLVILTGSASSHGLHAVLLVRAAAGTGNCVSAPATAFDVVGVAAVF